MRQLKGVLLAMISSSTFGLIPLFALPAMQEGVGLDSVLFYRFAISAVVVGAYLLLRRVDLRITLKEFGTMFLLGGAYASTSLFLTASYLYIPSRGGHNDSFSLSGVGYRYHDCFFQR